MLIFALTAFSFAACSSDTPSDTNDENAKSYKITSSKDDVFADYYSINSDYSIVGAGKTVTVSVET